MSLYRSFGKRLFDLFLAFISLVLLSPILLLIALLVKVTSRGPILYRQARVGKGGRTFFLLKFRTMVEGADRRGPLLTREGDPRITTFGKILRKTKLDELPQLFNVLRGDMSLVGPRPEVPRYIKKLGEKASLLLSVRPGITDEASILFRWEEDLLSQVPEKELETFYTRKVLPKKVELSIGYLEKVSLGRDLRVLLKTLLCLLPKLRKGGSSWRDFLREN